MGYLPQACVVWYDGGMDSKTNNTITYKKVRISRSQSASFEIIGTSGRWDLVFNGSVAKAKDDINRLIANGWTVDAENGRLVAPQVAR